MPAFEPDTRENPEEELSHDDGKCLWSSLLKEVTHKASVKLPSTRALIVLGDDGCGKTTLITRLQGTEDPKTSYGLEYTFIDIKDEDRDDQTKLNVWILDGDVIHSHLLKFALNADNFGECVVVIMVSMAEPWNIVESLEKWADILSKHIKRLSIPPETLTDYKNGLVQQFREYVEPDSLLAPVTPAPITHAPLPTAPTPVRRVTQALHPATAALLSASLAAPVPSGTEVNSVADGDGDTEGNLASVLQLPLDPTTLSENLGIPLVVVVTKTDAMKTLEKEDRFTEEHFDFIQMHIRRFCLTYGAALFYVSVKEDRNCDLLNRYLQSRIYGFPFTHTAYVVERDCVFVPTGWDSEKKIAILEENFAQIRPSDQYNDVIPRPPAPRKPAVRDPELVAQDEQSFLTRLIAIMQRDGNQPGSGGPTGNANTGAGANASSSEAILDQLATAAALTTGSGAPNQSPGSGSRATIVSPRTPQTGVRTKPSPGTTVSANVGSGGSGAAGGTRTSEGVLANFFTSLLNKRSNVAGTPIVAPPAVSSNTDKMSPKDLQSELERLARSSREQLEANKHVKSSNPDTDQSAAPSEADTGHAACDDDATSEPATKATPEKSATPQSDGTSPAQVADNSVTSLADSESKLKQLLGAAHVQSLADTNVEQTTPEPIESTTPVSSKDNIIDSCANVSNEPKATTLKPVAKSTSAKPAASSRKVTPTTPKQSLEKETADKKNRASKTATSGESKASETKTKSKSPTKTSTTEPMAEQLVSSLPEQSEENTTRKQASPEADKSVMPVALKTDTNTGGGDDDRGNASTEPTMSSTKPVDSSKGATLTVTKPSLENEAVDKKSLIPKTATTVKVSETVPASKSPTKTSTKEQVTDLKCDQKQLPSSALDQLPVNTDVKQSTLESDKSNTSLPLKDDTQKNSDEKALSEPKTASPKPVAKTTSTKPAAPSGTATPTATKPPSEKEAADNKNPPTKTAKTVIKPKASESNTPSKPSSDATKPEQKTAPAESKPGLKQSPGSATEQLQAKPATSESKKPAAPAQSKVDASDDGVNTSTEPKTVASKSIANLASAKSEDTSGTPTSTKSSLEKETTDQKNPVVKTAATVEGKAS